MFFFLWLYPLPLIINLVIILWAVATAISRICLARHHILDVVGGLVLAFIEYYLMAFFWLNDENARKYSTYISNSEDPWSSG